MRHPLSICTLTLAAAIGVATPASAVFHLTVIDELLTSYNGSPSEQFIELRMLAPIQNAVSNSVLVAFDSAGQYAGDILVVPNNVANQGTGVRWLVATAAFQSDAVVSADFTMPAGILPTGGGMVCFGGGGGFAPKVPPDWSRTDFSNYVDCVAYGSYTGPTNALIGMPACLNADGHSLQREKNTHNNFHDFDCSDPSTPQNNAGTEKSVTASIPCGECPATPTPTIPTPTPTPSVPTTTVTPSPTSTVTAAPPFNTPTGTPTCAATGTPYCADQCPTPPTARPGCPVPGGPCMQNPQCGPDAICLPHSFLNQCCACATLSPTRSLIPTASGTPTPVPTLKGTASATPSTTSPPAPPSGSATITAAATPIQCVGDCDASTKVTVNELIILVDIALGSADPSACPHGIPAGARVDIAMIVRAVGSALNGCGTS